MQNNFFAALFKKARHRVMRTAANSLRRLRAKLALALRGRDPLVSEERFVPEFQSNVPWGRMHESRYAFASTLVTRNDMVLDIACGAGYGTDLLTKYAKSVIGVDKSKKTIRYARGKYAGAFICQDFFDETPVVDVVVSFETIEHIQEPIELTVRSLIKRCDRLVIGSVPYREQPGNPFHQHFHIEEKDLDFMKKHGRLKLYYQEREPGSGIYETGLANPQNIIFVLYLRE